MIKFKEKIFLSLPSFFVDKENLEGEFVSITNDEHHHLRDVLNLGVGEEIEVMLGDGYIHLCEIWESGKRETVVKIKSSKYVAPESEIVLFMALIKSERMDWAVQKVTECGVSKIVPFESEYCVVKDKGNKADRLIRIAVAACKQSGRAVVPSIASTISFKQLKEEIKKFSQVVVAYEGAKQNAKEILSNFKKSEPIALIIGSEGGFSEREIAELSDSGAEVISMGRDILRAETASVALVSALNYELGLWERKE